MPVVESVNKMNFFSKTEIKKVGLILLALILVSAFNFSVSIRKGRDAQRTADLVFLRNKLEEYQSEIGYFPSAGRDGTILACKGEGTVVNLEFKRLENPASCRWGEDGLINYFSETPKTIMENLPLDPQNDKGIIYVYRSNGNRFQLYGSLEGKNEAEYNSEIENLEINCGNRICNLGKAFSDTPLNKSIDAYERELLR